MPVVLVPWRSSPDREQVWTWLRKRYAEHHPDWTVRLCEPPEGPWCKAAAVNPALAGLDDIVIVADADVWCDGLAEAVVAVEDGRRYAIPHHRVHRLTESSTTAVLSGAEWRGQPLEEAPYPGLEGGGVVVARSETLRRVPPDPHFAGWGQEDASWGMALFTLLGSAWRGSADLLHLWHQPQPRLTRKYGSAESRSRYRRYVLARHNKPAMRKLIEEIYAASTPSQPDRLGDPAYRV